MRIGILNDVHWGWPDDREMESYLRPHLEAVVAAYNDAGVDVVVGLGDYIEQGGDAETDRARLAAVGDVLADLDAPLYAVPGNHDVVHLSADAVAAQLDAANDAPYAAIDMDGVRLVLLDTTHDADDFHPVAGTVGERQRDRLQEAVRADRPVVVMGHHPLYYRDLAGTHWFGEIPELGLAVDKERVHGLVREQADMVVAAHIHDPHEVEHGGTPFVTLDAMNKVTHEPGIAGGAHVLAVDAEKMELSALAP